MTTTTGDRGQPWGRACGLLGGCAVTVAGVVQQVDPDVILARAATAAVVVALAVGMFRGVVAMSRSSELDDDE